VPMASGGDDRSPEPVVSPRPLSDPAHRPFPLVRAVLTIATGAALVVMYCYGGYIHEHIPNPRHTLFGTLAAYSLVVMSVVGLLNGAILFWTWRPIRGAAARGLLLAATGALTGAVAGSCIGSMEWEGNLATISRAAGAFFVGFINMVVWAVGGAVGGESRRARTRIGIGGEGRSWRPRLSLVGLAILTTAAFDLAYLHAYTTKPLQGLERWGARNVRNDALANIAFHNVSVVGAILIGFWVARRISDGRSGGLVPVAVVFLLLFILLATRWSMLMLGKIGQP
jgi:hypothetical protein